MRKEVMSARPFPTPLASTPLFISFLAPEAGKAIATGARHLGSSWRAWAVDQLGLWLAACTGVRCRVTEPSDAVSGTGESTDGYGVYSLSTCLI